MATYIVLMNWTDQGYRMSTPTRQRGLTIARSCDETGHASWPLCHDDRALDGMSSGGFSEAPSDAAPAKFAPTVGAAGIYKDDDAQGDFSEEAYRKLIASL